MRLIFTCSLAGLLGGGASGGSSFKMLMMFERLAGVTFGGSAAKVGVDIGLGGSLGGSLER